MVQIEEEKEVEVKAEEKMPGEEDGGEIGVEVLVMGGNTEVDVIEEGETSGAVGGMEVVLDSQV